jgi:hypothetical protein
VALSEAARERIRSAAGYRCEYCKIQSWPLTIDHVVPKYKWNTPVADERDQLPFADADDERNLCCACIACNVIGKRQRETATDPLTGTVVPLFNPRTDSWDAHFEWRDDFIQIRGLTPVGRATIDLMRLNGANYQEQRRLLRAGAVSGLRSWPD